MLLVKTVFIKSIKCESYQFISINYNKINITTRLPILWFGSRVADPGASVGCRSRSVFVTKVGSNLIQTRINDIEYKYFFTLRSGSIMP